MLIEASGSFSVKKMSRSERLFKSVLRKASTQLSPWSLAWAEFGRTRGAFWMKRGMGILALVLFTIAGQSVYGVAHWFFPFLVAYVDRAGRALTPVATARGSVTRSSRVEPLSRSLSFAVL